MFTEPDAAHFLAVAAEHSRFSDLYTCGFLTGLRLGELLGLQLSDDLVLDGHRVLHVQRTLYRGPSIIPSCPGAGIPLCGSRSRQGSLATQRGASTSTVG